jgi:hypothetical protein
MLASVLVAANLSLSRPTGSFVGQKCADSQLQIGINFSPRAGTIPKTPFNTVIRIDRVVIRGPFATTLGYLSWTFDGHVFYNPRRPENLSRQLIKKQVAFIKETTRGSNAKSIAESPGTAIYETEVHAIVNALDSNSLIMVPCVSWPASTPYQTDSTR